MMSSTQGSYTSLPLAGPVVTDNGNFVIDAPFDREKMQDSSRVCIVSW